MNNSTSANSTSSNSTNRKQANPFHDDRSLPTIIVQVTLLAALGVVIVFGNLASFITFIRTRSLRRRSHYLIISLSVADLLIGVVDFMTMYFFLTGPQYNTFLISLELVDSFTGMASILTLSAIAVERFFAVFFPFRHRMIRFKVYVVFLALPWVISVLIAVLFLISLFVNQAFFVVYTYHTFMIGTLSLITLSSCYISIGMKIRNNRASALNQNQASREKRLAVTLLIVTLASLLTWLPLQGFLVVLYICKTCTLPHFNVLFVMKFLQFCNSGVNVFIYMVRMPEFRSAFTALLCAKSRHNLLAQDSTRLTGSSLVSMRNSAFVGDEYQANVSQRSSVVGPHLLKTNARANETITRPYRPSNGVRFLDETGYNRNQNDRAQPHNIAAPGPDKAYTFTAEQVTDDTRF